MTDEDAANQSQEMRTMPFAAFGCDLAWGRTDAVLVAIIIALGG